MANTKNYSLREKIIDTYLRRGWYTRQQLEDGLQLGYVETKLDDKILGMRRTCESARSGVVKSQNQGQNCRKFKKL